MKKKRYYKNLEVFCFGRGAYLVHGADEKYWPKGRDCYSCCFRMNRGRGACAILACHADEREDNKEVIFERL